MGIQKPLLCLSTILLSLLSSSTPATTDPDDDSFVMAKLASALNPTPSSWSTDSSHCTWDGVGCDDYSYHVNYIDLRSMSLSGSLPFELCLLTHLETLSISENSLSGSLPNLANFIFLRELKLDNNNFTSIPTGFFQGLSSLEVFDISNNIHLAPWTIPTELSQLTILISFAANNANVMGPLPDIFHALPDLHSLMLSNNSLTGSFPASFGKSSIQILWLNDQEIGLTGTIDVLSQMTQLQDVFLGHNQFTGPIPDLSTSTYLSTLQLSENLLTGMVPASLISLPHLFSIDLANNMLQGPSPVFPKNVKNAVYDNNNFCTNSGDPCDPQVTILLKIAAALDYPVTLSEFWKGNDVCNDWPCVTCNSLGIMMINLTNQHFGGMISPAFANLPTLQILLLNENNLTGSIPDNLTNLPQLRVLDVSNNNLFGKIPAFVSSVKLNTTGNHFLETGDADRIPDSNTTVFKGRKRGIVIIITAIILGTITIGNCTLFIWSQLAKHKARKEKGKSVRKENGEVILLFDGGEAPSKFLGHNVIGGSKNPIKLQELPLLNYEKLATATNNFHLENKLGEGGFGPVYKGTLQDGQEIALKRLSRESGQGLEEFINEMVVISKLQHRNLVKLLGCCIEGEEKILVYEYMPNKSLDAFLFDPLKKELLDWKKRLNIIQGIARGLLYLHRDSRLKIIHRDLKPSNILLDEDLNPKISDFGMARIFGGKEDQADTNRVVGTYGYMSPEYVMEGRFSEKSDVFSFGVLLLEALCGRRNTSFYQDEQALSLLGYAWKLWNDDNIAALIDPSLINPCFQVEILRCVHVGLLCVQEFTKDRPSVSTVISMLDGEIVNLPTPKQPAFIERRFAIATKSSQQLQQKCSINNVTVTIIEGR